MTRLVVDAIVHHLEREATEGGYESADAAASAVEDAYGSVAHLLGAHPRNIAIVENATVAFCQALATFDFKPGDVIVTTRNDFGSNQLTYLSLARRCGVEVRRAADLPSGGVDPDSVRDELRHPRARLLAVTWVPTNSGLIQSVESLGAIAESAGIPFLLDACQAVGELPINVEHLGCDFLAATARKFLRGPRGIGFLYVSDRALTRGDYPLYIDMAGATWREADRFDLSPDAKRFENWEFAYSLVLGLGAAARYATTVVGVERGGNRARALAADLRRKLSAMGGCRVLDRGAELAAIVTAEVAGWDARELETILRRRGINVSATLREYAVIDMDDKHAASALRSSPHYYNTDDRDRRTGERAAGIVDAPVRRAGDARFARLKPSRYSGARVMRRAASTT